MLQCLIVEDEPLAADILQDYILQVPFVALAGRCSDALQALEFLRDKPVDVLFLDLHLPGLKGIDFLKSLKKPPAVILTTAYHEYALQGYELNVVDYLLKPIEFKRFLEAINKVPQKSSKEIVKKTITIQRDKRTIIIPVEEILYLESQKEYIKIYCRQTTYTTKLALSALEKELDPNLFMRVHRSFIVALEKISAFNLAEVEINGKKIPIGGNFRAEVSLRLKKYLGESSGIG